MNWKPSLTRCAVMSFGLTLVGCGSAAPTGNNVSSTVSQQSADAADSNADVTLVTLDLPGMT